MYVVDSSARKATITLTGEEVAVKFPCTYSVFGIKGDSMLLYPKSGMAQGDDGVYDTAEGDGSVIMCLHYQADTVYIKGTGDCVIWAGNSPLDCPFPKSGKGGGGSSGGCNYKGTTTTAISNGSTTNPIVIDGEEYTAVFGDIVVYNYTEFVFDGTTWSEFGRPFDTTPTKNSANAVTSDGIYKAIPFGKKGGNSDTCYALGNNNNTFYYPTAYFAVGIGAGLRVGNTGSLCVGKWNVGKQDSVFEIGWGTSDADRSNIVEVNSNSTNVNGDIKRDGVGIDDYTTTERKIGKWIDGSDLYQRTFEVTGLTNDGVWNQRILGTSDIDIVDWIGYLEYEDRNHTKQRYPINFKSGEYDGCCISVISDLTLMAKITPLTLIKAVITIKYTKPSVQANVLNANIQQTEEEPTDEMR